jgi:hypothetical protein
MLIAKGKNVMSRYILVGSSFMVPISSEIGMKITRKKAARSRPPAG